MKTIALAALAIFAVSADSVSPGGPEPTLGPTPHGHPSPAHHEHHEHHGKPEHQGKHEKHEQHDKPHGHDGKKLSKLSHKIEGLKALRQNFVAEGKFETPAQTTAPFRSNIAGGTTAWKATGLEIGQGTVYNYKWKPKTQVLELDSDSNQVVTQTITNLAAGKKYHLTFEWAARVGHLESCGGVAKWNGQSVVIMDPQDINIHHAKVTVVAQEGANTLEFDGTKASDGYGLGVTNVKLQEVI